MSTPATSHRAGRVTAIPTAAGRLQERLRLCFTPPAASRNAPQRTKGPLTSSPSRSGSIPASCQGSRAPPQSSQVWTATSRSSAPQFQKRNHWLENRAKASASRAAAPSSTRLTRRSRPAVPR